MTSKERTAIYKQGFMEGYKLALKRMQNKIYESEGMLPIIPEEMFEDGANPQPASQVNHSKGT